MMMIIVVINMRVMTMIMMKIMLGWSHSPLVSYNMEEYHHYDIDHEVFCLAIHKSRFFWPDCVRMKIKFEQMLLIELI